MFMSNEEFNISIRKSLVRGMFIRLDESSRQDRIKRGDIKTLIL